MKNWKEIKIQFRLFLAEWLLSKAFDWAPDGKEGLTIRAHVMEYFTGVIGSQKLDDFMKSSFNRDVAETKDQLKRFNER